MAGLRVRVVRRAHVAILAMLFACQRRGAGGALAKSVAVDEVGEQAAVPLRVGAFDRHRPGGGHAALEDEGFQRTLVGIGCGDIVAGAAHRRLRVVLGLHQPCGGRGNCRRSGRDRNGRGRRRARHRWGVIQRVVEPDVAVADHRWLAGRAGRFHAMAEVAGDAGVIVALLAAVVVVALQLQLSAPVGPLSPLPIALTTRPPSQPGGVWRAQKSPAPGNSVGDIEGGPEQNSRAALAQDRPRCSAACARARCR